jgi:hypothetical protein
MRTTLDLDDDVLAYAREKAKAQATTIGKVVSAAVRAQAHSAPVGTHRRYPVIAKRLEGPIITASYIRELRDESE